MTNAENHRAGPLIHRRRLAHCRFLLRAFTPPKDKDFRKTASDDEFEASKQLAESASAILTEAD